MRKLLLLAQLLLGIGVFAQPTIFHFGTGYENIQDVARTNDGTIWLATANGIARKTPGTTALQFVTTSAATHVRSNGTDVWAMGSNFVGKYDGTTFVNYFSTSLLPVASVYGDITIMSNGEAWVLHQGVVYRFVGSTCSIVTPPVLGISSITSKNNTLYLGTDNATEVGVMYDGATWTTIPANTLATGILGSGNLSMGIDANNAIYAENRGGIFKYENNQWTSVLTLPNSSSKRMVFVDETVFVRRNAVIARVKGAVIDTISPDYISFSAAQPPVLFGAGNNLFVPVQRNGYNYLSEVIPSLLNTGFDYQTLNGNTFSATFLASGEMGNTATNFLPTTIGGVTALFHQNLWLKVNQGGLDNLAANPYRQRGADYYSGPVSDVYDSAYLYKYNRVWAVTKAQIETHKASYNNPSYTAPHGIVTWPGNGDVTKGEGQYLAPFADYNFNGVYEPFLGEHPEIRGDAAVYTIFNDMRGPKTGTLSGVTGMEIHCMAYAFDSAQVPASQNALFTSYKFINRSNNVMNAVSIGSMMDFDLGLNSINDMMGSDSISNLFYCYNADVDDLSPPLGFGPKAPAIVGTLLNQNLDGVMYFQNSPATTGNPITIQDYLNLMNFQWKDSSPLRLTTPSGPANTGNGTGHAPNSSDPITRWAFNEAANWYNSPTNTSDSRLLPIANIGALQPQESKCLDYVIVHGRDLANPTNDILASLAVAKSNLNAVKTMYNNLNYACLGAAMSTEASSIAEQTIRWYPNPIWAGGTLVLEGLKAPQTAVLTNMTGQTIALTLQLEGSDRAIIPVPQNLSAGLYAITITTTAGQSQTFKVLVE